MGSKKPYREMSDADLENYLGGLPRCQPGAELRARLLATASNPTARPKPQSVRLLFALAVLLLLANFAVQRQQEAGAAAAPAGQVEFVPSQSVDDPWLRKAGYAGAPFRVAVARKPKPQKARHYNMPEEFYENGWEDY